MFESESGWHWVGCDSMCRQISVWSQSRVHSGCSSPQTSIKAQKWMPLSLYIKPPSRMERLTITPVIAVSGREGLHTCEPCSYKTMQATWALLYHGKLWVIKRKKKKEKSFGPLWVIGAQWQPPVYLTFQPIDRIQEEDLGWIKEPGQGQTLVCSWGCFFCSIWYTWVRRGPSWTNMYSISRPLMLLYQTESMRLCYNE